MNARRFHQNQASPSIAQLKITLILPIQNVSYFICIVSENPKWNTFWLTEYCHLIPISPDVLNYSLFTWLKHCLDALGDSISISQTQPPTLSTSCSISAVYKAHYSCRCREGRGRDATRNWSRDRYRKQLG